MIDNPTLQVLNNRVSLRVYDQREISQETLDVILEAMMRAPTAGNQMLYSVIVVRDQKTKEILAQTCDHQAFIATAPVILIFLADHQRWFDYYRLNGVAEYCDREGLQFEAPQESDLLLAIEDAMIAAQNAVIAAESMGIGSCYIGDIVENYEVHRELFDLPDWAFPIGMLCLGYYRENHLKKLRDRFDKQYIVFDEKYKHLTEEEFAFMPGFKGKLSQYGITPDRRTPSGIRAAIIREKGTNGEREMAYSLYLAGFDVKDVTMTDLISGRETLEDVNMIVYCGGFSNSDVLGSAKGWAGGFLFNPKAKEALDKFYARKDTLSLGICNGCQLMMELGLINPEHKKQGKMLHNESHKFESTFIGLTIPTNRSVMFGSLSGSKLGIWVAHGEGKFSLPYEEDKYNVVAKYSYDEYPGNPNGSDYSIAGLVSEDGRHLAMMPHLERSIFPWQNACYPADRVNSDQVTPWIEAFVNARKWVEKNMK